MEDTQENSKFTQAHSQTVNWGSEFGAALEWANKRAWPLGGAVLFTSTVYLHNYLMVESVSLSIASSAAITALPTMFALVLYVCAISVALVLIPTAILFTPVEKNGSSLAAMIYSDQLENRKFVFKVLLYWIFWTVSSEALLWVFFQIRSDREMTAAWQWTTVITLLTYSVIFFGLIAVVSPIRKHLRQVTWDYWFTSMLASLVQSLMLLSAMQILLRSFAERIENFTGFLPVFCGVVFLISIVQSAAVILVQVGMRSKSPVAIAGVVMVAVIWLLGLIPPVSAKLVGYAIQTTTTGGRACSVLVFVAGSEAKYAAMRRHDRLERSQDLRILFDTGEAYQVRPTDAARSSIYFVQRIDVAGIEACAATRKG